MSKLVRDFNPSEKCIRQLGDFDPKVNAKNKSHVAKHQPVFDPNAVATLTGSSGEC